MNPVIERIYDFIEMNYLFFVSLGVLYALHLFLFILRSTHSDDSIILTVTLVLKLLVHSITI